MPTVMMTIPSGRPRPSVDWGASGPAISSQLTTAKGPCPSFSALNNAASASPASLAVFRAGVDEESFGTFRVCTATPSAISCIGLLTVNSSVNSACHPRPRRCTTISFARTRASISIITWIKACISPNLLRETCISYRLFSLYAGFAIPKRRGIIIFCKSRFAALNFSVRSFAAAAAAFALAISFLATSVSASRASLTSSQMV